MMGEHVDVFIECIYSPDNGAKGDATAAKKRASAALRKTEADERKASRALQQALDAKHKASVALQDAVVAIQDALDAERKTLVAIQDALDTKVKATRKRRFVLRRFVSLRHMTVSR